MSTELAIDIRHIDIGQHDINIIVIHCATRIDTIISSDYLLT